MKHDALSICTLASFAFSIFSLLYLHAYPALVCKWHIPEADLKLLALADPQIEGNAKLARGWQQKLDIWGNDRYLQHIHRTLMYWMEPSHVVVLGDLFSSQWIDNLEFERRVARYRDVIFRNRIPDPHFVNVTGNHDIGYAGDVTYERTSRYEKHFGRMNYQFKYKSLNFVVLNSLVINGPAQNETLIRETYDFLDSIDNDGMIVLLTHVPLHKPQGLCSDAPEFSYYESGLLREQTMISSAASVHILEKLFGRSNNEGGLILTGHDHVGCDITHYYNEVSEKWMAVNRKAGIHASVSGIREVTVRSMMGEFGGHGAFVSGKDVSSGGKVSWEFEVSGCSIGVQHIWWVSNISLLVSLLLTISRICI